MTFDEAYALSGILLLDNIRKKRFSPKYWLIQFQPPLMMLIPALTYVAYITAKELISSKLRLMKLYHRILERAVNEARDKNAKLVLRLPTVIMGSLIPVLVYFIAYFTTNSIYIAVTAGLISSLYPSFIAATSIATLDGGMTFWSIASILLLYLGVSQNLIIFTIIGGFMLGMALSSKITGAFSILIGLIWLSLAYNSNRLILHFTAWILPAMLVFYISWPILWSNPIRLLAISRYLAKWHKDLDYGFEMYRGKVRPGSDYFISHLLTQMPNIMILLLPLGLLYPLLDGLNELWLLAVCGLMIPLAILSLPNISKRNARLNLTITYPFMAIIGGLAFPALETPLSHITVNWMFMKIAFLAMIVSTLIRDVMSMHPYHLDFFNTLAGGLKKAKDKYIVFGVGEGLEEATKFVDENASSNSIIWAYIPRTTAYFHLKRINLNTNLEIIPLFCYSPVNPNPLGYEFDGQILEYLRRGDLNIYFPYYFPEKNQFEIFRNSKPDLIVVYRRFTYPGILDEHNRQFIDFLFKHKPLITFVKKGIEVAYVFRLT